MNLLNNKTVFGFGDSLVAGLTSSNNIGMLDQLVSECNMVYSKYATLNSPALVYNTYIQDQVDSAPSGNPYYVVFDCVTNDCYTSDIADSHLGQLSSTFDDNYDTTTFYGALEHLIYTLKSKYPNSRLIAVTPHKNPNRPAAALNTLYNAAIAVYTKWNIAVADVYKDSGLDTNDATQRATYSVDGTHLNALGYKTFYQPLIKAKMIELQMETISEKLIVLNNAKQDIKAAIIEKGQTVGDNMNDYAEAIGNISGGGSIDDTDYFCIETIENTGISMSVATGSTPNIEYSFDKLNWTTWNYDNIDVEARLKIYFRGDNPDGVCNYDGTINFVTSSDVNVSGNIFTLQKKDGNITKVPPRGFCGLLRSTKINMATLSFDKNVELSGGCFLNLFKYSTIKIAAFELPYLTLWPGCYLQMYQGCTQLILAPYISAVTATWGYATEGCEDGAGPLYSMFSGCSSIQYIKTEITNIETTSSAQNPTFRWLYAVASTGCFIKAKNATWTTKDTSSCPSGWTLITSVS